MLKHLFVRNYALIRELDLDLDMGLSVITGETGAGKSILLGALRLILGDRADSKVLFESESKCIVEGEFDISNYDLSVFFDENDLDYADQTILRREILVSGKSRAFVNDTPVNLSVMKDLGERLADIHSQHETMELKSKAFQFDILDSYADTFDLRANYFEKYKAFKTIDAKLSELKRSDEKSKADLDYFRFQLEELNAAQLKTDEMEHLESEFEVLSRSEEIQQAMSLADSALNGEQGILDQLRAMKTAFDPLENVNERLSGISSRFKSALIELDDLSSEISGSGTDFDQQRFSELGARLDLLNGLLRKHQVQTVDELIAVQESIAQKLDDVDNLDQRISEMTAQLEVLKSDASQLAEQLNEARQSKLNSLCVEIERLLTTLSMPDSKIRFEMEPSELNPHGNTDLQVLFRTNLGTPFELLHKAASGGEMARLMLSLKSIVAVRKKLPTIVFDEIDTGVSGEVASKMGGIMQQMGKGMQVIAITHLPQVAGKGEHHFNVYKASEGESTNSHMRKLTTEERLTEIAKMLSGDKVEQSALDTARGLIQMN